MDVYTAQLIAGLVFAVVIFMDANKRQASNPEDSPPSPVIWAIVGFLFGFIGAFAYVIKVHRMNRRQTERLATAARASAQQPPRTPGLD